MGRISPDIVSAASLFQGYEKGDWTSPVRAAAHLIYCLVCGPGSVEQEKRWCIKTVGRDEWKRVVIIFCSLFIISLLYIASCKWTRLKQTTRDAVWNYKDKSNLKVENNKQCLYV